VRRIVRAADGTRRFRANLIVSDLLDIASGASGDKSHNGQDVEGRWLDLNTISQRVQQGVYSRADFRELYQLIGYSVCGYLECFPHSKVRA
jgi:hypothetical protein